VISTLFPPNTPYFVDPGLTTFPHSVTPQSPTLGFPWSITTGTLFPNFPHRFHKWMGLLLLNFRILHRCPPQTSWYTCRPAKSAHTLVISNSSLKLSLFPSCRLLFSPLGFFSKLSKSMSSLNFLHPFPLRLLWNSLSLYSYASFQPFHLRGNVRKNVPLSSHGV